MKKNLGFKGLIRFHSALFHSLISSPPKLDGGLSKVCFNTTIPSFYPSSSLPHTESITQQEQLEVQYICTLKKSTPPFFPSHSVSSYFRLHTFCSIVHPCHFFFIVRSFTASLICLPPPYIHMNIWLMETRVVFQ